MLSTVDDVKSEIVSQLPYQDLMSVCYANKTMLSFCQHDKQLQTKKDNVSLLVYHFFDDLQSQTEFRLSSGSHYPWGCI